LRRAHLQAAAGDVARAFFCLSLVAEGASSYTSLVEASVEKLTALFFLVTGLSHIFAPRAWVRFFIMLREKQEVGSLLNGLVHFPLGAFIVAFHNVWHGMPMLVTIIGWGLVLKSTIYFVYPPHGVRMLATIKMERSWHFVVAGIFSVVLAGVIFYPLR
jgi:uncharacterized protein YjeT (DUF2065 family)